MINIRPLTENDLSYKIRWYNDERINKYLHYEEKFEYDKTLKWFKNIKSDLSRFENIIEYNNKPVGIIGLFEIDKKNRKAGIYITIGELDIQGKGIAYKTMMKFMEYCFNEFELEKIYLYTDLENIRAQKLYEKIGFRKEGILRRELYFKDRYIDRVYYGMLKEEFGIGR